MKKLMIGLILAAGCLTGDIHAGLLTDNKDTVTAYKNGINQYIKAYAKVYMAACDAIIEVLNNLKKNQASYKTDVTADIKVVKLFKSAFTNVYHRKKETTITSSFAKCTGQLQSVAKMMAAPAGGVGEGNIPVYFKDAIVALLAALPVPTQTAQAGSLAISTINLFNTFKGLQSGQPVTAPAAGAVSAAPVSYAPAPAAAGGGW